MMNQGMDAPNFWTLAYRCSRRKRMLEGVGPGPPVPPEYGPGARAV